MNKKMTVFPNMQSNMMMVSPLLSGLGRTWVSGDLFPLAASWWAHVIVLGEEAEKGRLHVLLIPPPLDYLVVSDEISRDQLSGWGTASAAGSSHLGCLSPMQALGVTKVIFKHKAQLPP